MNGYVRRDLVAVGASAGGLDALKALVAELPADFPAAVLITVHMSTHAPNLLATVLNRKCALPVRSATDGQRVKCGEIYVAPSDHHLVVQDGKIGLGRGPRENGFRPAIDVMFRSAAVAYGVRVIGVVLTGNLDDGTAGCLAIKQCGGTTIAQDPHEAVFPSMPQSIVDNWLADHVSGMAAMPKLLQQLTTEPIDMTAVPEVPPGLRMEVDMASGTMGGHPEQTIGEPSNFGCPDCGGPLREIRTAHGDARFRCHVGHAWAATSLSDVQRSKVEEAVWIAIRWLDEERMLATYGAERARRKGREHVTKGFEERAERARLRGDKLRSLLREPDPLPQENADPAEAPDAAVG